MKSKILIFIFLLQIFPNPYPGYDKAYFQINTQKYLVSELNLELILKEFGSDYEPIEIKSMAIVDSKLKPLNQSSFFRIIYTDKGIEFLIKSDKEILLDQGMIKENNQIEFSKITPEEVRIFDNKIVTNVGVQIEDSIEKVEDLFGESEVGWAPTTYPSIGLGFNLNNHKQVEQISIRKPY